MRASDLIGLPVVSIASGEDVAEIRDVVYDGEHHQLVGFTLNKRGFLGGRLRAVLSAAALAGIGTDAVMVHDESAVAQDDDLPEALLHPERARAVIGNRVLSSDGTDLGRVVAVILQTGDQPQAVGYEFADSANETAFFPISAQMALSGENVLLPKESTEFFKNDLVGFGASIASYRSPRLEVAAP